MIIEQNKTKEKICGLLYQNNYQITFVYKNNIKARIMEDLFVMIEKKMDILQNYHNGILTMMGKFKSEIDEKEKNYKQAYFELKTLLEIFSEYNTISNKKSINTDIDKLASKFSQTSLESITSLTSLTSQIEKTDLNTFEYEKLLNNDIKFLSTNASPSMYKHNVSLVSQISEQFSKNPTLCESPKTNILNDSLLINDKKYNFGKTVTSSPLSLNGKKCNFEKSKDDEIKSENNKFTVRKKIDKIFKIQNKKHQLSSNVNSNFNSNSNIKSNIKSNINSNIKSNRNANRNANSNSNSNSSSNANINFNKNSNKNTNSNSIVQQNIYLFNEKNFNSPTEYNANRKCIKSPLSTIKKSEKTFTCLHYNEPNICIDYEENKLYIRKKPAPKFVGDIERTVVETICKKWNVNQVLKLRALINGYFCKRLYNCPRMKEIRKIINESERIYKTTQNSKLRADILLSKAVVNDIKLHKDIVYNIFFETTLNSRLQMINEIYISNYITNDISKNMSNNISKSISNNISNGESNSEKLKNESYQKMKKSYLNNKNNITPTNLETIYSPEKNENNLKLKFDKNIDTNINDDNFLKYINKMAR